MNPNVRYIENKNKQKTVNRNQLVGCKASAQVGNVEPLGAFMPLEEEEKKKEKKIAKRGKTCRLQSQNGVDYGGPLGAGTTKQEEKGSSGNGRWAGEPERAR